MKGDVNDQVMIINAIMTWLITEKPGYWLLLSMAGKPPEALAHDELTTPGLMKIILFYLWKEPAIYMVIYSLMIYKWLQAQMSCLAEWLTYGWWGCKIGWNCMGGVGQCPWFHPLALPPWLGLERLKHLLLEDHDDVGQVPNLDRSWGFYLGCASRWIPWFLAPLVSL